MPDNKLLVISIRLLCRSHSLSRRNQWTPQRPAFITGLVYYQVAPHALRLYMSLLPLHHQRNAGGTVVTVLASWLELSASPGFKSRARCGVCVLFICSNIHGCRWDSRRWYGGWEMVKKAQSSSPCRRRANPLWIMWHIEFV